MDAEFVPGTGDSLIVALTSYGGHREAARACEWKGVLAGVSAHKLFLKDSHQHWYHGGLVGFSHGLDGTLAVVRAIMAARGMTRLMCLGSSMGGHGALLLGHQLRAQQVLAIAPQVNITPQWMAAAGDRRWEWKMAEIAWAGYDRLDVGSLYRDFTPPDTRIYVAADDALDVAHARLITDQGVARGVAVPGSDHELALELARSGVVAEIAAGFVTRR